jgi:hypothetical protein
MPLTIEECNILGYNCGVKNLGTMHQKNSLLVYSLLACTATADIPNLED